MRSFYSMFALILLLTFHTIIVKQTNFKFITDIYSTEASFEITEEVQIKNTPILTSVSVETNLKFQSFILNDIKTYFIDPLPKYELHGLKLFPLPPPSYCVSMV